jgi:hypothetical protein
VHKLIIDKLIHERPKGSSLYSPIVMTFM